MNFRKAILRIGASTCFILSILIIIILNPIFSYSYTTNYDNYTIYHNKQIDKQLIIYADSAALLLKKSELYDAGLKLDICMNDGSVYPSLLRCVRGQAYGWGFYNKVVLMGDANYKNNYAALNGYRWNLTQLLTHEMTHCYQFRRFGLLHSNPVAGIPNWKWEGYPEYVARQNADQKDLAENIARLAKTEREDNNGWIQFGDSTGAVIPYYKSWLLMQYCMDIKHMTYGEVLKDKAKEEEVTVQMMEWYRANAR